jgi:1-acyl-sn-glycerol-3-phosphate acyltransferase
VDPAFLLACSNRPLHFLQARECYEVPLLRRLFSWAGLVPVRRKGSDVGGIRQALRLLARGEVLAIFPEGEVGLGGRGGLGPGKQGAALLALRSGALVLPAWIEGGPEPKSSLVDWLWPSAGARVRFGDAINLDTFRHRPINPQRLREVTELLMRSLAQLAPRPCRTLRISPRPRRQRRTQYSSSPPLRCAVSSA